MKLLLRTGRYYFLFTTLVFVVGAFVLLLALRLVLKHETNERLRDGRDMLHLQLPELDSLPDSIFLSDNVVEIRPITTFSPFAAFTDTLRWNALEDEFDPYRKYTFHDQFKGQAYRISLSHSKLDDEKLVATVVGVVLGILSLLLLAINLFNRSLSLRIWNPFYQTIGQIKNFNFEKGKPLAPPPTDIEEFAVLHQAIKQMTTKVLSDYRSLKQFTENASHEIQTPLAIIKSNIELLFQKEDLSPNERLGLQQIHEAATRLSKIQQSLLLLIRIENRQFTEKRILNFKDLIERKIDQLEPLILPKNLKIQTSLVDASQTMDPSLAEIMLNNLLGNAIKHCPHGSTIEISLQEHILKISNPGPPLKVPPEMLFERFRKGVDSASSLGLGLAIVKEICTSYGFRVKYENDRDLHHLVVQF